MIPNHFLPWIGFSSPSVTCSSCRTDNHALTVTSEIKNATSHLKSPYDFKEEERKSSSWNWLNNQHSVTRKTRPWEFSLLLFQVLKSAVKILLTPTVKQERLCLSRVLATLRLRIFSKPLRIHELKTQPTPEFTVKPSLTDFSCQAGLLVLRQDLHRDAQLFALWFWQVHTRWLQC